MNRLLWAFVFGLPLTRADFVDPMIVIDEQNSAVRCTVNVDCAGEAECTGAVAWATLASKQFREGKMFVATDDQSAECTVGFRGNSISMYGLRQKDGAEGEWSVDSGPSTPFSWALKDDKAASSVEFLFRASALDPHLNHTLRVSVVPTSGANKSASVDYFVLTDPFAPTKAGMPPLAAETQKAAPVERPPGAAHGHHGEAGSTTSKLEDELGPGPGAELDHELHPPVGHDEQTSNDKAANAPGDSKPATSDNKDDKPKTGEAQTGATESASGSPEDTSDYGHLVNAGVAVVVLVLMAVVFKLRRQLLRMVAGRRRAPTRHRAVEDGEEKEDEALLSAK